MKAYFFGLRVYTCIYQSVCLSKLDCTAVYFFQLNVRSGLCTEFVRKYVLHNLETNTMKVHDILVG